MLVDFPPAFGGARYVRKRCECEELEYQTVLARYTGYADRCRAQRYFDASTLGQRFMSKTFEQFTPNAQTSVALRKSKQFVLQALHGEASVRVAGLLFIGPVGTGKSHLAAAIYNELKNNGKNCVFISVPDLLDRLKASYSSDALGREADVLEVIKQCELLVLDDVGAERHTGEEDWASERLFAIFDHRYRNMLPTIGTTNCQPNILEDKLGARTMSRLREMCELVPCLGNDYRKTKAVAGKND